LSTGKTESTHGASGSISLLPILSVNFIGTLGFSIVMPFLVFLVTRWGGNALVYGLIGATYSAFQLVGAPILGRWSDRYGRRKILLLSQLGTMLSWVVFTFAFLLPLEPSWKVDSRLLGSFQLTLPLVVLFVARAADGLTGGNVSVANAYLADITSEEERSTNFGKMSVSTNLGFILGPAIAGLLGATALGELLPVLAALGISAAATLIIAFRLPESRPCVLSRDFDLGSVRKVFGQEHKTCVVMKDSPKLSLRETARLEGVPLILSIYFLVMLGFNFFYVAFPVYAVGNLRWSVTDTGVFFAVLSLLMVIVQGPILSRVARKVTDCTLVLVGGLILAAAFAFFATPKGATIYSGAALMALGNGLMWPSVVSLLSKAAGERYQGAVQGVAGSLGAAASILGLILGGLLFGVLEGSVFLLSAGTILVAAGLSLSTLRYRSATQSK
jgi:DHA1 family tetracycline resistance protein-like MFS transporter